MNKTKKSLHRSRRGRDKRIIEDQLDLVDLEREIEEELETVEVDSKGV